MENLYKRLVNKDAIDYVIGLYKEHNLTNEDLLSFYKEVKWYGSQQIKEEFNYLEQQIRENSKVLDNVSEPTIVQQNNEWAQKNTDVFFSKELFKQELIHFFDQHNIEKLDWDLLYQHRKYDETDILNGPFELLADFTRGNNEVTVEQVLAFVEQTDKFEDYLFTSLKDKLTGDPNIELNEMQINQLADWVRDRVSKADIKMQLLLVVLADKEQHLIDKFKIYGIIFLGLK
jgi:hypothetical protein